MPAPTAILQAHLPLIVVAEAWLLDVLLGGCAQLEVRVYVRTVEDLPQVAPVRI